MCKRTGGRLCFHKDLRLRSTRKYPNLDILDLFLCMRRHPVKSTGEKTETEKLTDGHLDRCAYSRQIEK